MVGSNCGRPSKWLPTGLAGPARACHIRYCVLFSAISQLQSTIRNSFASGTAVALALPAPALLRGRSRTRGPDDDEDDELRWLMPILAAVIGLAAVFG